MAGAALVTAASLVACGGEPTAPDSAARPDVAAWKLWVLPSAGAVAVAPPDAAASQPAAGAAAGEGLLGEQWIRLAMEYVSARTKDPPAASRAYALVSVAMSDALVAAAHWQAVYGAGYPSEGAAVGGAGSRLLAYLFPEQPALRLDQMADDVAAPDGAAGAAGLALGREVAGKVVAYAQDDGSQRAWDGTRPPDRPGYWQPPPGSVSPPVEPLAGTWRTWVLPSGGALRPPAPPSYGSPAYLAEGRELVKIQQDLTDDQKRIARFWEGGQGTPLPPGIWNGIVLDYLRDHHVHGPEVVRTLALVNVALADAGVAAWDAKYAYWTPRPENGIRELIDPAWRPLLRTPLFPAYVSGHSTYSAATAVVLAHLFPADAHRFLAMGEEAGTSRLYGGIHWRSDHTEGARMGRQIGRMVVERARLDEPPEAT
jgi:hypothetical protein